jgi:RNA polymerase sigma-70 factor (ECF subfamily)
VTLSEPDLTAAMTAALQGREDAYALALVAIAALVRTRVRRRLRSNWADVEDVVQETLLSIHLKRGTWDPSRPLVPWVHAIADHKLIDWARRKGRQNRLIAAGITVDTLVDVVPAPEEDVFGIDLDRHLAVLSPREQVVVRGLAVEGRSVRDVAATLGLREGAVRVALHRGLKRLASAARKGIVS